MCSGIEAPLYPRSEVLKTQNFQQKVYWVLLKTHLRQIADSCPYSPDVILDDISYE